MMTTNAHADARPVHTFKTIAIDGPAGSGKSTIGSGLARHLGFLYFDTGVMYRAVTLAALQASIDVKDQAAISAMSEAIRIEVLPPTKSDGRQYTVLLDGDDVTWDIRQPEVDAKVSTISAFSRVRAAMVREQQRVAHRGQVVMVGRDIGTVVMPSADLKLYLDASVEERARRRCVELQGRGTPAVYNDVLTSMRERDRIDSTRAASPLRPADNALIVDCTDMDEQDTLEYVIMLVDTHKSSRIIRS